LIDSNEIGFIGINLRKGKKKGKDIRRRKKEIRNK
jgi:hypothetical protein